MMFSKRSSFKEKYFRILINGPCGVEDYDLARELIDSGYAKGKYEVSRQRETYDKVKTLIWIGINSEGRMFADELKSKIDQQSFAYKVKSFSIWFLGLLAGVAVHMLKTWYQCT